MGRLASRLQYESLRAVTPYVYGDVLDLACGRAELLNVANGRIASYTGVELSANRVRQLRAAYPRHHFVQRDLDTDPLDLERRYDTVLLISVIEHIYNQKHLLQQILRVLQPTGRLVVTTPTPFGSDFVHRWGSALGLIAEGHADEHIVLYNRRRFELIARDFDLEIERYRRFQLGCNQLVVMRPAQREAVLTPIEEIAIAAERKREPEAAA